MLLLDDGCGLRRYMDSRTGVTNRCVMRFPVREKRIRLRRAASLGDICRVIPVDANVDGKMTTGHIVGGFSCIAMLLRSGRHKPNEG